MELFLKTKLDCNSDVSLLQLKIGGGHQSEIAAKIFYTLLFLRAELVGVIKQNFHSLSNDATNIKSINRNKNLTLTFLGHRR